MTPAFIIMAIGREDMDAVCREAIVPALKVCGLDPKRVDKHNEGGLLMQEIMDFIGSAQIIVADLTYERPNCYLEIGYVRGVDRFRNLILTAREDYCTDSPNHRPGGPKVHFDLQGYDVLFWDPNNVAAFRTELEKRVRRRLAVLKESAPVAVTPWDDAWISRHRDAASGEFKASGKRGCLEVRFTLQRKLQKSQTELLEAARHAQIHTFGWPIGIVLDEREEFRPKPTTDGIVARIALEDRSSYDYWAIRRNGDFYLMKSLFEDERSQDAMFYNTRIVRVTETLLYCARLYSRLGVPEDQVVHVMIRHDGLRGRMMAATGHRRFVLPSHRSNEEMVDAEVSAKLGGIQSGLVSLVKSLTHPMFQVFDFFVVPDNVYEDIVNSFVAGKVR